MSPDRCRFQINVESQAPDPLIYPQGDIFVAARMFTSQTVAFLKIAANLSSASLIVDPIPTGVYRTASNSGYTFDPYMAIASDTTEDLFKNLDVTNGSYNFQQGPSRKSFASKINETDAHLTILNRYSYPANIYIHDKSSGLMPTLYQIPTDPVLNISEDAFHGYSQYHGKRFIIPNNLRQLVFFEDTDSQINKTNHGFIDLQPAFNSGGASGTGDENPVWVSSYGHAFSQIFLVGGTELGYISMDLPSDTSGDATLRAVRNNLDIESELSQTAYSTWSFGHTVFDGEFLYVVNKEHYNSVDGLLAIKLDKDLNTVAHLKTDFAGDKVWINVNAVKSFLTP